MFTIRNTVLCTTVTMILLLLARPGRAQTSSYGELQSAYIYNFAKYIKWPAEYQTFTIGVFGDADIMDQLAKTLKGKKIGGKEITLKKIGSAEESAQCHIVYLPSSKSKDLPSLLKAVNGKSVLVVTEEDLIKKGAVISFVVEDDKLRFKLNQSAMTKAGLIAAEGLLKLAIIM